MLLTKGANMRRTRRVSLIVLAFMFIGGAPVAGQTTDSRTNWQYLTEKMHLLRDYHKDFLAFARSLTNEGAEYEILNDLEAVADINEERLDTARILIHVYEDMSCKNDRLVVKDVLKEQLRHYVKLIDLDIDVVNDRLSRTTRPAVSQTAIRMKDDLRDVRAKLDTLRTSLE